MEPAYSSEQIEQLRRNTRVKGEVICRDCNRPARDDQCGRLHDPEFIWQRVPEALMELEDIHEWQGEKWGLRNQLPQPTAGYSTDCLTSSKGEKESYCLQWGEDWQIHVRWQDHPFYQYTVHREYHPINHPICHGSDWVNGHTKKIRENSRITRSAYEEPVHLHI